MIELVNEKPHTHKELEKKWPNCVVCLHSYEIVKGNPNLNNGIPYLIIEEKDSGVVKRTTAEFPQYKNKAIISTYPIGPGLLSNYALPGVDYGLFCAGVVA